MMDKTYFEKEQIMDNYFLLLGKTGVGKSTQAKILSENESIQIGQSLF